MAIKNDTGNNCELWIPAEKKRLTGRARAWKREKERKKQNNQKRFVHFVHCNSVQKMINELCVINVGDDSPKCGN